MCEPRANDWWVCAVTGARVRVLAVDGAVVRVRQPGYRGSYLMALNRFGRYYAKEKSDAGSRDQDDA